MPYVGQKPADIIATAIDTTTGTFSGALDVKGAAVFNEDSADVDFRVESNANANMIFVDGGNNKVGINDDVPVGLLSIKGGDSGVTAAQGHANELVIENNTNGGITFNCGASNSATLLFQNSSNADDGAITYRNSEREFRFKTAGAERMRIDSSGNVFIGTTTTNIATEGTVFYGSGNEGVAQFSSTNMPALYVNRSNDGTLVDLRSATASEGTISISGSTTSFNGGHLSRWSRLLDNSKDTSIVKGTVMTNLNEMVEWKHEKELWNKDDELPDGVSIGDVKKDAYTEDNEQLNKMAVSGVEGDVNVAGVFVNWDNDDNYNDMNVAMTGDMVIRIAKDTTVAKGDLLMSAGDGTAKTQGDDIVRSKTIAKVTSTNVSHTYDDGTYLVPCVLMAC